MGASYDLWKMLAGVAFFLLAMNVMETSLHALAGRKFKLFLKRNTGNPLKAVGSGALVSSLMQSSSIVNLLVLSLVGAGVVQMGNALALMLGSNMGSTFTGWLLVTFGFNYGIDQFMLPVTAVAGILMAFISPESKWYAWVRFAFSFAFLFVALGFIRTGMEGWVSQTDLSFFTNYPAVVFVLIGVLLTGLVQSSSATIALALSALYTGAISLYIAMAIALGSEIGTTLKLFLASANGMASKKRVALGNFLFNVITVIIVLPFLYPIYLFITEVAGFQNQLYALVFFQSIVNLICAIIFFPFLTYVGRFLMSRYVSTEDQGRYIGLVPATDPPLALDALEHETRSFVHYVMAYSLHSFDKPLVGSSTSEQNVFFDQKTITEKYEYIKQLHGKMHGYCLRLQNSVTTQEESGRLNRYMSAIRNSMYAAKNIRDAQPDILQSMNSSNDVKYQFYVQSGDILYEFYRNLMPLIQEDKVINGSTELERLYKTVTDGYAERLKALYRDSLADRVNEVEISTLINFNRELYTSLKSMLFGLKDLLLSDHEAEYFDSLPGFIR